MKACSTLRRPVRGSVWNTDAAAHKLPCAIRNAHTRTHTTLNYTTLTCGVFGGHREEIVLLPKGWRTKQRKVLRTAGNTADRQSGRKLGTGRHTHTHRGT